MVHGSSGAFIDFDGDAFFTGVVYAPDAEVRVGSESSEIWGALVGELTLDGSTTHGEFHYDNTIPTGSHNGTDGENRFDHDLEIDDGSGSTTTERVIEYATDPLSHK